MAVRFHFTKKQIIELLETFKERYGDKKLSEVSKSVDEDKDLSCIIISWSILGKKITFISKSNSVFKNPFKMGKYLKK
jgi:hypothetical protein